MLLEGLEGVSELGFLNEKRACATDGRGICGRGTHCSVFVLLGLVHVRGAVRGGYCG